MCLVLSISDKLFHLGFRPSKADTSLFYFHNKDINIYILVYVDDIVITRSSPFVINKLVNVLSTSFPIKDLGWLSYFLGIEALHNLGGITLMQHTYATDLLHRAHMENWKSISTPMSVTENSIKIMENH